jgi:hypothetical protein
MEKNNKERINMNKLPNLPSSYAGQAMAKKLYDVIIEIIEIEIHNAISQIDMDINVKSGSGKYNTDARWNTTITPKRF